MSNQRAFSLIEAMVSLVILLVGLMGFSVAFTSTLMHSKAARSDSQALFLATSFVEELKAKPFDDWADGDLSGLAAQFNANYYGELDDTAEAYYIISAAEPTILNDNARRVTVTVTWSGWNREQSQSGLADRMVDGTSHAFVYEAVITRLVGNNIYGAGS